MFGGLTGKSAFIAAAAQGIDRAMALSYLAEVATVLAADINQPALDTPASESPHFSFVTGQALKIDGG